MADKKRTRTKGGARSHTKAYILKRIFLIVFIAGIILAIDHSIFAKKQANNSNTLIQVDDKDCFKEPYILQVGIADDICNEMVSYSGFEVSFNSELHVPNYVAWTLTPSETDGEIPRKSGFEADPNVAGCASLSDYRKSGFDRGHMAPAADMKWSELAMKECHYLSNIIPQDHSLNSGRWNTLENQCRTWAKRDSDIVIVCGPVLTDEITRYIGDGVAVPERIFKVVLAPYANPPRAIGFVFPNYPTKDPVESFVATVDEVETITGLDFFVSLPDSIENAIEAKANYRDWTHKKRK